MSARDLRAGLRSAYRNLRDLVSGLAEDHLPRHTQQLLALLEPAATPAT